MELKDLVGKKSLTGVEAGSNGEYNYISFTLDNITYTVEEDENDGWRSSAREIIVESKILNNRFKPVDVICSMKDSSDSASNDILIITDIITCKEILRTGTENYDDWYPCYIAEWIPENMCLNN